MLHSKCRNTEYPRSSGVKRHTVDDHHVSWDVKWPEYNPPNYTDASIEGKEWADLNILGDKSIKLKFNQIDGIIDRTSFMGNYKLNEEGLPLNPRGRTGIKGRGCLGRWGPNHAADPIVTRWKRNEKSEKVCDPTSNLFILQFASIKRKDTGEWAIPGGMVDAGEHFSAALKREFSEEAMDSTTATPEKLELIKKQVDDAFRNGVEIYKGYVDDPRNTDNAWMETVAVNYHDDQGDGLGAFSLKSGDDAAAVQWADISKSIVLYASHRDFIESVAKLRKANW